MRDMDLGDPEDPEDSGGEVNIDTKVETCDGKVTISFTVPIEDLATLESVIVPDFLDKLADALYDKFKSSGA